MLEVTVSMYDVQVLCGLLYPLCMKYKRHVAVTASMYDVQALCGLLRPLCMMHVRYVGC